MRSRADRNRSQNRNQDRNRGRSRSWVAGLVLAGLVAAAPAAHAAALPFTGSLSLLLGSFGVGIPGSGVATVNGSGGLGHLDSIALPAGAFAAQGLTVSITTLFAATPSTAHSDGSSPAAFGAHTAAYSG